MADAEVAGAEQLVFDAEQVATLDHEMPTPHEPHRLAPGGSVERLRDGRSPVDHDRIARLVGDGEPADVEALERVGRLGRPVDAAEHERRIAQIEVGEALDECFVEGVALEPRLERATQIGLTEVTKPPRRLAAALEALVGVIDVGLLVSQIWVLVGHWSAMSPMRATRRQPRSGQQRPAWPGNAMMVIRSGCRGSMSDLDGLQSRWFANRLSTGTCARQGVVVL